MTLSPTFIPFTPWTSLAGYLELLGLLAELELVAHVAPIQLAIRLLVPRGSRLLEVPELRGFLGDFDADALSYPWRHPDPRVDQLYETVRSTVEKGEADGASRHDIFKRIWRVARHARGLPDQPPPSPGRPSADAFVPRLTEPWYCCAEPTSGQFARV